MCVGVSSAAVALVRLLRELLRFAHKLGRLSWRVVWCATHFGSTHHTSLSKCVFFRRTAAAAEVGGPTGRAAATKHARGE
jgi:hypothetical protein